MMRTISFNEATKDQSQLLIYLIFTDPKIGVWSFFDIKDVLNLSVASTFSANLIIPSHYVRKLTRNKLDPIGRFKLKFPTDLTTGMFRRVLNRIHTGTEAYVSVDASNGTIILDIGSALNNKDIYLAPEVVSVPATEEVSDNQQYQQIFKHLEISSYDEYDDFMPRHPLPKEKNHRRGDSYFNSDVDMYANEVLVGMKAFDMQNLANAALDVDLDDNNNNLKNKFLQRKKSTNTILPNSNHQAVISMTMAETPKGGPTNLKTTNKFPGKTRSFNERMTAGLTSTESDEER